MTAKSDPVVGISSFNNAETIASCRLWRRKVTTNSAASTFRSSGSLTAACSAIRRRTIHLNRLLNLRGERDSTKTTTTKSAVVADEEFSAIHELIRLVGNVTFFDVLCRLTVKDADVVQSLGVLLEYNGLSSEIAASIVRLFGNLCESKESAVTVLQTKPCIRMIVHLLTKNLDNDLASAELSASEKAADRAKTKNRQDLDKLREHCVRTLRNAAQCGKNFGHYLIRSESVFGVGRCLRLFEQKPEAKAIRDYSFQFLQQLLPLKDQNFSLQILRSDILEKSMDLAKKNDPAATKLILGMVTHYSSLRCELSKLGAIEWLKERMEKLMEREKWTEEVSNMDSSSIDGETLMALIRMCRDAYTRAKLRDSRALDLLLDIFVKGHLKETKFFIELMSAFLCFLYDDQGLKYLVEFDGFLDGVIGIVSRHAIDFPCSFKHLSKTEAEEEDDENEDSPLTSSTGLQFRADSPSYKRFRLDPTAAASNGDEQISGPLCKDFTVGHSWSSPSLLRSPSSPGPSWSPSASSLASLSSMGSASPPMIGGSSWSPASDPYRGSDDLECDWVEFECGRRYSSCSSQIQTPLALCECEIPEDDASTRKDRDRLLWAAVKLISWLSHSPHASLLANDSILTILLPYIAGVCRPEPRIGRMIERLTQNRQFTESLIELDFHRNIYDTLCATKCGNGNEPKKQCVRCRKVSKIGHGILRSLRAQVDTDFGFGTMEHIMASNEEETRLRCLCAMLYLTKSNWRVKRLMSGENGAFASLMHSLSSNEVDETTQTMVAKAFYAGLDKGVLRDRIKWSTSTSLSNKCAFHSNNTMTDENRVTFVSKEGDGRIDCNMETLSALSPFYRAMFSGSYAESTQRHFIYDDEEVNSDFRSFVYYVHFLHGCRNCDQARLNSADECLAVLELADKRLCCSLGDYVVNNSMTRFLKLDNVQHFISNAIVRRDLILYRFCMDFLFSICCHEEFLGLVSAFRISSLGVEFFLMLTNYLKGEFKFE